MTGFVKVYSTILDSSIWGENLETRVLWITLLAMADADGVVQASKGGLARRANLPAQSTQKALEVLLAPDLDDRSGVQDGRRIEPVKGGWLIINHSAYREMRSSSQERTAERVRRWREKKRDPLRYSNDCNAQKQKQKQKQKNKSNRVPQASLENPDVSKPDGKPSSSPTSADVREIFEYWQTDTGHPNAKLDQRRRARIQARLREGFSVLELRTAIRHRTLDPWLMGDNPGGRVYDGLETLLRDAAQVERLRDLNRGQPKTAKDDTRLAGWSDVQTQEGK